VKTGLDRSCRPEYIIIIINIYITLNIYIILKVKNNVVLGPGKVKVRSSRDCRVKVRSKVGSKFNRYRVNSIIATPATTTPYLLIPSVSAISKNGKF
jgi:hypothetical protein